MIKHNKPTHLWMFGVPKSPGFVISLPPRGGFWKQSKWPWNMIHSTPCRNPCRLYIHLPFTYSVGPSKRSMKRTWLAPPVPPMRVLEVVIVTGPQSRVWSGPLRKETFGGSLGLIGSEEPCEWSIWEVADWHRSLQGGQVMSASGSSTYRDSGFKRGRWRHILKMLKVPLSFKEGKWALNHGMFLNWTAIYLREKELLYTIQAYLSSIQHNNYIGWLPIHLKWSRVDCTKNCLSVIWYFKSLCGNFSNDPSSLPISSIPTYFNSSTCQWNKVWYIMHPNVVLVTKCCYGWLDFDGISLGKGQCLQRCKYVMSIFFTRNRHK
jgi:hypothetical protein